MMVKFKDVEHDKYPDYVSLTKLTGKKIKDVSGILSGEYSEILFQVTQIEFEDGTSIDIGGIGGSSAFLYPSEQPNCDAKTLAQLRSEMSE